MISPVLDPSRQWHETSILPLKTYHNTFGGRMYRLRIPIPHLLHWAPVGIIVTHTNYTVTLLCDIIMARSSRHGSY